MPVILTKEHLFCLCLIKSRKRIEDFYAFMVRSRIIQIPVYIHYRQLVNSS